MRADLGGVACRDVTYGTLRCSEDCIVALFLVDGSGTASFWEVRSSAGAIVYWDSAFVEAFVSEVVAELPSVWSGSAYFVPMAVATLGSVEGGDWSAVCCVSVCGTLAAVASLSVTDDHWIDRLLEELVAESDVPP